MEITIILIIKQILRIIKYILEKIFNKWKILNRVQEILHHTTFLEILEAAKVGTERKD